MTPELFGRLVESFGLPVAMTVVALLTVLRAWTAGWLISRREHDAIVDELRSRAERGEANAEYWLGAYREAIGLAKETQEVARDAVRHPAYRSGEPRR